MYEKKLSGDSALPMDRQGEQLVKSAGIPLKNDGANEKSFPAQLEAARRSRQQMAQVSPRGVSGKNPQRMEQLVREMSQGPSKTDPNGSWTGVPENPWETPVQDADDL